MNGTSNNIWFGLAVLLGVGVVLGNVVILGVRTGRGVALGSDSNPGSELVLPVGVFIDLKAIQDIKIPATSAVINKIKYNGIFLIICPSNIPENSPLCYNSSVKKLKIAQIAPLWIPIPPRTYGGIELMLYGLEEELVKRGYDVTLYASGDSTVSSKLKSPTDKALWLQKEAKNPHAAVIKMLHMINEDKNSFDLIHNHFNFFMFPLALCDHLPPMLTTIHRPIDDLYADAIKLFSSNIKFCVLSEDAKKSAEEKGISVIDVVPNGIDPEKYPFNAQPDDYLLYLGRLNKGKGIVTALNVAKRTGHKIVIAGNMVGAEEWTYFMEHVQPLINDENVKFVGQADFQEKVKLFQGAKATLFPIDRREPFGLVMIESMACGTPVVAFNKGSVPEVIEDGKTGFIVDTEDEMIEAVNKVGLIDRSECRKLVEKKFTLAQMTDRYEKLYAELTR